MLICYLQLFNINLIVELFVSFSFSSRRKVLFVIFDKLSFNDNLNGPENTFYSSKSP